MERILFQIETLIDMLKSDTREKLITLHSKVMIGENLTDKEFAYLSGMGIVF